MSLAARVPFNRRKSLIQMQRGGAPMHLQGQLDPRQLALQRRRSGIQPTEITMGVSNWKAKQKQEKAKKQEEREKDLTLTVVDDRLSDASISDMSSDEDWDHEDFDDEDTGCLA